MKRLFFLCLCTLMLFVSPCLAIDKRDTLNVLLVGNSQIFFNNLPQMIAILSNSCSTELVVRQSTAPAARLRDHWVGNKGLKTKEIITNGSFDIIVIQEWTMGSIQEPDSLYKYSKLFIDLIKKKGAKPFLFQTPAREKVPQQQEIINSVYADVASKYGALVIPVGSAWRRAKEMRPDINLYLFDGSHPERIATFLSAYIFIATILGEVPKAPTPPAYDTKDINGEYIFLMYLNPLDVEFCSRLTEEFIKIIKK